MARVLRIVPPPAEEEVTGPRADDEALVTALRARDTAAASVLVKRYGSHLRRVLLRVLGGQDNEVADVLQEVIVRAWEGIAGLKDPGALKSWLTQIAVFTARGVIRGRHRRRWLTFFETVPEPAASWAGPDFRDAAASVYRIFDRMPVDERIPFALRMLEGLDLEAIAAACSTSVATVRRRLARAERRFFKMARGYDSLAPWLEPA